MTPKLRALALVVPAALAFALSACAGASGPDASAQPNDVTPVAVGAPCDDPTTGVEVRVDASVLGDADDVSSTWCVSAAETIAASAAVAAANLEIEGTKDYPDQIVCRVDGVPSEDTALKGDDGTTAYETCASMPPTFAYWSLWIKHPGGEWGYAEEGLSTLQLEPGDALQLLFVLNNEPAAPTS